MRNAWRLSWKPYWTDVRCLLWPWIYKKKAVAELVKRKSVELLIRCDRGDVRKWLALSGNKGAFFRPENEELLKF